MKDVAAIYNGKHVDKNNFRAFVYASDGRKILTESWGEFQSYMQNGIWFANKKDAQAVKFIEEEIVIPKRKKREPKVKNEITEETKEENQLKNNELDAVNEKLNDASEEDKEVFEVKEDDFLPK